MLCPVYAARETNEWGVDSSDLQKLVPGSVLADSLPDAARRLGDIVRPGDLIFTMGAGDVFHVADYLRDED